MKSKIVSCLLVGVSLTCLLALSACKTSATVTSNPDGTFTTNLVKSLDAARIATVANAAASEGTTEVLKDHPEWIPKFQLAATELNQLASSPSITLDSILAIAQQLPVKELKSNTARLSFEGATLLISLLDVPALPSAAAADLQPIAAAIAAGITQGLANSPPPAPAPSAVPTSITVAPAPAN